MVFNFLYSNLTHPNKAVSGAAARAMNRLCDKCGRQLGEPVLALYDQVEQKKKSATGVDGCVNDAWIVVVVGGWVGEGPGGVVLRRWYKEWW